MRFVPTDTCSYPMVDQAPARLPITSAPSGVRIISAAAPTATPPASVAFWMCSIVNFLWALTKAETAKAQQQAAQRERSGGREFKFR